MTPRKRFGRLFPRQKPFGTVRVLESPGRSPIATSLVDKSGRNPDIRSTHEEVSRPPWEHFYFEHNREMVYFFLSEIFLVVFLYSWITFLVNHDNYQKVHFLLNEVNQYNTLSDNTTNPTITLHYADVYRWSHFPMIRESSEKYTSTQNVPPTLPQLN